MRILLENKNSEIEKLQKRFPYDKNVIKNIYNSDPTYNGDYAQFISRTLPAHIYTIAGSEGGLSVAQSEYLYELYSIIRWFDHNKKNFNSEIIQKFLDVHGNNKLDTKVILNVPENIYSYS